MMAKVKATSQGNLSDTQVSAKLETKVQQLEDQLVMARENERRALADYQNLIRRTEQERGKVARLAAADFILSIIEPLTHLNLAAQQLNDRGIKMVIAQLWENLERNGLSKIEPIGQNFDALSMEAVETTGDGQKVSVVISPGYQLNGQVIQHAKVVVGDTSKNDKQQ